MMRRKYCLYEVSTSLTTGKSDESLSKKGHEQEWPLKAQNNPSELKQ